MNDFGDTQETRQPAQAFKTAGRKITIADPVIVQAKETAVYHDVLNSPAVPDYKTSGGALRKTLDQIIAAHGSEDPQAARRCGDDVLNILGPVNEQIITSMRSDAGGVFRTPIQEMADSMKALDTESLSAQVNALLNGGAKLVKDNKGETALVAGGVLSGYFLPAVAAAGASIGFKSLQKYRRQKTQPNAIEFIEERINNALLETENYAGKLELVKQRIPGLERQIESLNDANRDVFFGVTLYLSAIREMQEQLDREIEILERREKTGELSFSELGQLDDKRETREEYRHKSVILQQARNESVNGSQLLRMMGKAINDNRRSMESLLDSEIPLYRRDLATSGLALDTFRSVSVTREFRDHIDQVRADSAHAADHAMKAAQEGRVDDPARLQKAIDRTNAFKTTVETMARNQRTLENSIEVKLKELENATAGLLEAHTQSLLEQSPRNSLPGPQNS